MNVPGPRRLTLSRSFRCVRCVRHAQRSDSRSGQRNLGNGLTRRARRRRRAQSEFQGWATPRRSAARGTERPEGSEPLSLWPGRHILGPQAHPTLPHPPILPNPNGSWFIRGLSDGVAQGTPHEPTTNPVLRLLRLLRVTPFLAAAPSHGCRGLTSERRPRRAGLWIFATRGGCNLQVALLACGHLPHRPAAGPYTPGGGSALPRQPGRTDDG